MYSAGDEKPPGRWADYRILLLVPATCRVRTSVRAVFDFETVAGFPPELVTGEPGTGGVNKTRSGGAVHEAGRS